MKLEKQVASFENSKKFADLGVTVKSYAKYEWYEKSPITGFKTNPSLTIGIANYIGCSSIQAYTVSELGEMLPDYVNIVNRNEEESKWWCEFEYSFAIQDPHVEDVAMMEQGHRLKYTWGDTMTECMAKMLIWLIENNHVTVEELNR